MLVRDTSNGAGADRRDGHRLSVERRRRLTRRALPLCLLALAAFFAGVSSGSGAAVAGVERFAEAWEQGELSAMHAELTPESAALYPISRFSELYERADEEATLAEIEVEDVEHVEGAGGEESATLAVIAETAAYGSAEGTLSVTLEEGRLVWAPHLVFPGLGPGERLSGELDVPERAPILDLDGAPLAEGPATARTAPPGAGTSVPGALEPATDESAAERGFPDDTPVGVSGLEQRVRGTPGRARGRDAPGDPGLGRGRRGTRGPGERGGRAGNAARDHR